MTTHTHRYTFDTPYFRADITTKLPIGIGLSPFQSMVGLYKSYFKFATYQTLTFFKKPATVNNK